MPGPAGEQRALPPLRDATNLYGLPQLSPQDQAQVDAANKLYSFTVQVLAECASCNIAVSIENPRRSWLWSLLTQMFLQTQNTLLVQWFTSLRNVDFSACMHGSGRDTHLRILATPRLYDTLALDCDNSHQHLPWSRPPRGKQQPPAGEYPPLLCKRMASCLAEFLAASGVTHCDFSPLAHTAMGLQRRTVKPLVPEFYDFAFLDSPTDKPGWRLLDSPLGGQPSESAEGKKRCRKTYKYGLQWTPEQFMQLAKQVSHPKNPAAALPSSVLKAVEVSLEQDPVELAKSRLRAVLMIRSMKDDLVPEEQSLKSTLEPGVAKVLGNKNILLWEALLKASCYDDMGIVDLVKQGIPLSGEHDRVEAFQSDWKPATISTEELLLQSLWRRRTLMAESRSEEPQREADTREATLKEVGLGQLEGPLTEREVTERFGSSWLATPRFILYQGAGKKIRTIDDCKRSGLNSAFTVNFKLQLEDIDTLACLLAFVGRALNDGTFSGSDGTTRTVHPSARGDTWLGRTLDLTRAYKQLPIHPNSRRLCVISFPVNGAWEHFCTDVLPFGAVASVYGFNRVSRSLKHILNCFLSAACLCYFDDFPTLSSKASSAILSKAMSAILHYLGWLHAEVGEKAIDFAACFAALGVKIDLSLLGRGSFIMANKEGRVDRICELLRKVSEAGHITRSQASEIQGLINFASSFYISKALKFLVSAFGRLSLMPSDLSSADVVGLCQLAITLMTSMKPRVFQSADLAQPAIIFTDGAWEDGEASAGGAVFFPELQEGFVFEVQVPKRLVDLWLQEVGDQLIGQIEMISFVAVRAHFAKALTNRLVVAWLDNEAARFACIKGTSDSFSLQVLARVLQQLEIESPTVSWFERVCSFSNPSDMPSRHRVSDAAHSLGFKIAGPVKVSEEVLEAIFVLHTAMYTPLQVPLLKGAQTSGT